MTFALDGLRSRAQQRDAHHVTQRGVGMIEVMVAMGLGAMLVVGVIQIFTASRQTFRMQDAMTITQESGTFAVDFIGRNLTRAGNGIEGDVADDNTAFEWVESTDGGAGENDEISIVEEIDAGGVFCTGENAAVVDDVRIANHYWVNDEDQLMCQGRRYNGATFADTGTAQVLVDNVESFQVLYGVDTFHAPCPIGATEPTLYVRASLVDEAITKGETDCPPSTDGSGQNASTIVRTVRIALLLRTPTAAGTVTDPDKTFQVLDEVLGAPDIDPGDGRLRRLFTKTVLLRTASEASPI